jgi:5-methylcytosine-specific restriction protein A
MATYLLTWNPDKWQWPNAEFEDALRRLEVSRRAEDQWSCGRTKRIAPGDRVFLLRQGAEPRGLVASGWVTSKPFPDKHWGASGAFAPQTLYVELTWDWLSATPVIGRSELDGAPFVGVNWNTQSSGISIEPEIAQALELDWGRRTGSLFETPPDEITEPQFWEGAATVVRVNAYERNAAARAKCIDTMVRSVPPVTWTSVSPTGRKARDLSTSTISSPSPRSSGNTRSTLSPISALYARTVTQLFIAKSLRTRLRRCGG